MERMALNGKREKRVINRGTISRYEEDPDRRPVRGVTHEALRRLLKAGEHFDSEMVAMGPNPKNGRVRIINGNHRLDIIKEMVSASPSFEIEVWLLIYGWTDNKDEQHAIYTRHGSGVAESFRDSIYKSKHKPVIKDLLEYPNTGIGTRIKGWCIQNLLDAYMGRFGTATAGYPKHDLLSALDKWNGEDTANIIEFMEVFESIYGVPTKDRPQSWLLSLKMLVKIFFQNKDRLGVADIKKAWKTYLRDDTRFREYAMRHNSVDRAEFMNHLLNRLNMRRHNRPDKQFMVKATGHGVTRPHAECPNTAGSNIPAVPSNKETPEPII